MQNTVCKIVLIGASCSMTAVTAVLLGGQDRPLLAVGCVLQSAALPGMQGGQDRNVETGAVQITDRSESVANSGQDRSIMPASLPGAGRAICQE